MSLPQFTLRALLVATMLVVAAFLGGMAVQRHLDRPQITRRSLETFMGVSSYEELTLPDGTKWERVQHPPIVTKEGQINMSRPPADPPD